MSSENEQTYTVTQPAVQRLLDAVQAPGAMPQMQRDWLIGWLQQNLSPQQGDSDGAGNTD